MIGLYWHTVRYLRPIQILGRLWYRMYRPRPRLGDPPNTRSTSKTWDAPQWRQPQVLSATSFSFLNERHELDFPEGWNANNVDKLWLYNLHYFSDLTASGAAQAAPRHAKMIQDWIAGNPPVAGIGWEPYPTSLRIVNWIKWSLAGNQLDNSARYSLAVQVRHLTRRLEVHLLGNHLFENAKALLFAGLFFEGPEAKAWYSSGAKILARQLPEQILSDGGHFERSPMYHSLILQGLLDLVHLHQIFYTSVPSAWTETASRMLSWLQNMSHPDGEVAFFNDSTFGIAPRWSDLATYSARLGIGQAATSGSAHLEASGFSRLESSCAVLLADVGTVGPRYLPGHAHAETLSFELSIHGERTIVNSGISCYGSGGERLRQRSTPAHSTLILDGQNSSVVWAGFRVAQRARAKVQRFELGSLSIVCASHDGYKRLRGSPVHIRTWKLAENSLEVVDQVTGRNFHSIDLVFHFHPDLELNLLNGALAVASRVGRRATRIELDPDLQWSVVQGSWHPGFGLSVENFHLKGTLMGSLPFKTATRFSWA